MRNLNLFSKGGTEFASLVYENKQGDVKKHVVNLGVTYKNTLKKDMVFLTENKNSVISETAKKLGFPLQTVEDAYNKVVISGLRNLNKDTETIASKAQKEAYRHINKAIKVHIETGEVFLYAMEVSSTLIKKGEPKKPVKSSNVTIARKSIEKLLKSSKYRNFSLGNIDNLNMRNTSF